MYRRMDQDVNVLHLSIRQTTAWPEIHTAEKEKKANLIRPLIHTGDKPYTFK